MARHDGADGEDDGASSANTLGRRIVLGRSRCRFHLFRASVALSPTQLASAARTYAAAYAPYANPGMLLLRSPHGAEIWWWDAAPLHGAKVLGPESVYRAEAADGWRIVACDEGFEAQYWESGGVIASTWRRTGFTKEQWAAFVLSVDSAVLRAPSAPPASLDLPLLTRSAWRKREMRAPLTWRDAQVLGLTIALCAACVTAFFVGQTLRLQGLEHSFAEQRAAFDQQSAADPSARRLGGYIEVINDYQRATANVDPLGVAADAFVVLRQFDLSASAWRSDQDGFEVTLNAFINDVPLRDLVSALEGVPSLCGVEPNLSSEAGALELSASLETPGGCAASADADGRR